MNEVILMSIRPEWLVKILNGEKTIEIRKSMPKCELPIDVYLYCTKGKPMARYEAVVQLNGVSIGSDYIYETTTENDKSAKYFVNGKVVAKFTLNKVDELEFYDFWEEQHYWKNTVYSAINLAKKAALNMYDIIDYGKGKPLYAWHIDNLVIFDKPKELSEFSIFKRETITCGMDCPPYTDWVEYRVYKAPQSWQYAYVI